MTYQITIYSEEEGPLYTRQTAAKLARVSIDFLQICEGEQFVRPQPMPGGEWGFSAADIRNLARVRRLRQSLGLDMPAVEVVLHLRSQVVGLQAELLQMHKDMERREQELLQEIAALRRQLAQDIIWE